MEVGFCEQAEHPVSLSRGTFPSKAGGRPSWLDPAHPPTVDERRCGNCGEVMAFLAQIYAPRRPPSGPDSAFHRTLYVFICKDGGCNASPSALKVWRSQVPRRNPYYVYDMADATPHVLPSSNNNNNDDDEEEYEYDDDDATLYDAAIPTQEESDGATCFVCAAVPATPCGGCGKLAYCCRSHAQDDARRGHAAECAALQADASTSEGDAPFVLAPRSGISRYVFDREHVIDICPEDELDELTIPGADAGGEGPSSAATGTPENQALLQKLIEEYEADPESQAALEEEEEAGGVAAEKDPVYGEFKDVIARAPDQVVRYGPDLVWTTSDAPPPEGDAIPPCPLCAGPRVFEFQILPQMLYYVLSPTLEIGDGFVDFANLAIYTCAASCRVDDSSYVPEFIFRQQFSRFVPEEEEH